MKEQVRASVVQFATEWLNLEKNIERMCAFVAAEAAEGSELIVFPELADIGYITPVAPGGDLDCEMSYQEFCERYVRAASPIPGPATDALSEMTRRHGVYVVVGLAQRDATIPGTLYNSGALIGPSGVIGVHHKVHLPFNEKLFFYPGNTAEVWKTELGNIGIAVCYDGRFPEFPRVLAVKGAEIICNIWAISSGVSDVSPGDDTLKHRAYTRAQENGLYYINCNRAGVQGKTKFAGRSAVGAPNGNLIGCSETAEEDVVRVTLSESDLIGYRSYLNVYRDRRPDMYGVLCRPLSQAYVPPVDRNLEQEYPAPASVAE